MLEIHIIADDDNGRFEIRGGSITSKEEFLLAGAMPRLEALVRNAPLLSKRILLRISNSNIEIKKDGPDVPPEEIDVLRGRLRIVVSQLWNQILAL